MHAYKRLNNLLNWLCSLRFYWSEKYNTSCYQFKSTWPELLSYILEILLVLVNICFGHRMFLTRKKTLIKKVQNQNFQGFFEVVFEKYCHPKKLTIKFIDVFDVNTIFEPLIYIYRSKIIIKFVYLRKKTLTWFSLNLYFVGRLTISRTTNCFVFLVSCQCFFRLLRSEERRVGKECCR